MIRRFFFAAIFGTLVGFFASRNSGPAAGLAAGLMSALGFSVASLFLQARLLARSRKGGAPQMRPGEEALLHGPCELSDSRGSSKAWAYLSNQRFTLRDEDGPGLLEIPLGEIEELRPDPRGLVLISRAQGMLMLKVPDPKRWLESLRQAIKDLN